MAISLGTNINALQVSAKLNQSSEALSASFRRLSSGLRITRPGDDPAGLQVADGLKADAKIAGAALQNASSAISYTSIADSALSGISSLLTRMAELAEQSANGVYANTQRSALSNEFLALGSEIQRIAKTTEFNGIALLSSNQNVTIQIGLDGQANSRLTLNAINGTLASLGLAASGNDQMSYSIIGTSIETSQSAAQAALDAVTGAITSLNTTRGSIGSIESRLNQAVNYLTNVREQYIAADSRIRDVDIAQEVANMVRLQVLQQAQTAVMGQANQQVSLALSLLS